jgi:hypothetical protein
VHDTSPHICIRLEHPFLRGGRHSFSLVLEGMPSHPFQPCASRWGASSNPPRSSRPSSLLRKERARCSESNTAIDESKRALTSSPMRPVRPGGTSTTDSSCPATVAPSNIRMGPRLGDACLDPLRVDRDSTNDSFERCHAPDLVTEECPDDGRFHSTAGHSPHLSTKSDLQHRGAGSPLLTFFACWTEKVIRGTLRSGIASPQRETALTRRCFFVSVIEHTSEQQDRCFRPRSTRDGYPGWERHEYA